MKTMTGYFEPSFNLSTKAKTLNTGKSGDQTVLSLVGECRQQITK